MSTECIEVPKILQAGIKFLKYLKQPYSIIPIAIKDGTKRPMCKVKNQPDNLFRVGDDSYIKQWSQAEFFGLVTNPSFNPDIKKQLFVVDVDIPTEGGHEKDGREHIHKLDITNTFTVQTPSGGIHYLYWAPLGHKFRHAPYEGIDLVWKSPFYFVGIGSPGYKLINKVPIADASEELLEQLKYVHENKTNEDGTRATILDDILKNGIASGLRHDTILKLMASLAKKRVQKTEALAIAELAISKCEQSSGLPTLEEASAQYDDAMAKFVEGGSIDDLLTDLVYIGSEGKIKSVSKPSAPAIHQSAILNVYPALIPNIYKPLNQHGNLPMNKLGQVWLDATDKKLAHLIGYKPCKDDLFEKEGVTYFNEYSSPDIDMEIEIDELVVQRFQAVFKRTYGPIYEDWLKIIKYKILNPHVKFSWCLYVTSKEEGTGKGISWNLTKKIFGARNCLNINPTEFNQRFNASFAKSTFALVDEAHGVVTKSARNAMMNALKRIITEDTMTTEGKNVEKDIGVESFFFMSIFSNDRTSLEINKGSRRFLVYHDEEPKTDKEVKLMNIVGKYIENEPDKVAMFVRWMMENVDITITKDFNPKSEARKTEDLLTSDSDVYMSPDVLKVKEDILAGVDIFHANLITWSQLEYYCAKEFGINKYTKISQELKNSKVIHRLLAHGTKSVKRINLERPDMSLAREGIELKDAYKLGQKSQTPIYMVRNFEDILKITPDKIGDYIHDEIRKNSPRKSSTKPTVVDK